MQDYIYLIAPAAGWLAAQAIKFAISLRKDGVGWNDLVQSGGMPSSHSAFMTSITTVIGLNIGVKSVFFGLAAAITAIVIYDSIGVRRATGENSVAIKELSNSMGKPLKTTIHLSKGHSIPEVVAGCILGVVLASILKAVLI